MTKRARKYRATRQRLSDIESARKARKGKMPSDYREKNRARAEAKKASLRLAFGLARDDAEMVAEARATLEECAAVLAKRRQR